MTTDHESRRIRERIALSLPVRVHCRETVNYQWTEMSRMVDVTPFGARLRLKRPTEIGRLLHLTTMMPRQLRCFDHVEDQYRIWSLVRNLKVVDPNKANGAVIEIGVAFVGKHPPQSFEENPIRRYDIGKADSGLWTLHEGSANALCEFNDRDKRKETRHIIPVDIFIEVFSEQGGIEASEATVTENISTAGAAVFTSLEIEPGRFVKVSSPQHGRELMAVVRSRHTGSDGITRLHLEFIGSEWPL
jgi:PilZ domain-containing protein